MAHFSYRVVRAEWIQWKIDHNDHPTDNDMREHIEMTSDSSGGVVKETGNECMEWTGRGMKQVETQRV